MTTPALGRHALIISSAHYESGQFEDRPTVARSAKALQRIFRESPLWATCHTVSDPRDASEVMTGVLAAVGRCGPGDTLLVYYVGHADSPARADGYRDVCLALRATVKGEEWSYLALHHIYDALRAPELGRTSKILVLDCCNCGDAQALGSTDVLRTLYEPDNGSTDAMTCVLKALDPRDPGQVASAHQNGEGHSDYTAFSGHLIDILSGGIAGKGDPLLVNDVYGELRARLVQRRQSIPEQLVRGEKSIILLENRSQDALVPSEERLKDADRLARMSLDELVDAWAEDWQGFTGLRATDLKDHIAKFVDLAASDRVQQIAHRLLERNASAQLDELHKLVLTGKPTDVGATVRALELSPCPDCAALAGTLDIAAIELFHEAGDTVLFEYTRARNGRRP